MRPSPLVGRSLYMAQYKLETWRIQTEDVQGKETHQPTNNCPFTENAWALLPALAKLYAKCLVCLSTLSPFQSALCSLHL